MTEFVTKKVVNTYGDGQFRGHYCGIKKRLMYIKRGNIYNAHGFQPSASRTIFTCLRLK